MRPVLAVGLCALLLVSAPGRVGSQLHGPVLAEPMQASGELLAEGGATASEAGHGLEGEGLAGESLEHHGEAAEGHGGHGGHGEGHGEMSPVQKTTSYLLIGFMVTNFVMLRLVVWPDANIRSYTWKMMSSTISIYLAVLLNNAIRDAALHAALRSRCEEGSECAENVANLKVELVIRFSLFAVAFALTNILCYVFRNSGRGMYASQVLSGHITAFAGIGLFGNLGELHDGLGFLWASFIFTSFTLVGFRFASRSFRDSAFGSERATVMSYLTADGVQQHTVEVEEWREAVCEAEDDGCSIYMSYMLQVLVTTHMFGEEYHHILLEPGTAAIKKMAVAQGLFIAALVIFTYWRRSLDRGNHEEVEAPTSAYTRSMSCFNIVLAMSMSWLSLKFFNCVTMKMFPGISHEFDEIISAAVLTGCAIVGILLLDCCADKVEEVAQESAQDTFSFLPSDLSIPGAGKALSSAHVSNLEKAVRSLISGFALAVGLSWEKAFHAALSTVIRSNPWMDKHYVISQGLLAVGSCMLIMPVWLSFIVPMAKKTVQDHQLMMELSKRQG